MKEAIKWGGICENCIYLRNINVKFYWLRVPKQYPVARMAKEGWRNEEVEVNKAGSFEYATKGRSCVVRSYNSNWVGRVAQSVKRLSYGLDGRESNVGDDEIFRPSRPALGPTQSPLPWVSGLFQG